jgi:two-component system sensor histidine kinase AtoS
VTARTARSARPSRPPDNTAETLLELEYLAAAFDHEIRSPLNAAVVQASIIEKKLGGDTSSPIRNALGRVEEILTRFGVAVRGSEEDLGEKSTPVARAIAEAILRTDALAKQRGVTVRSSLPSGLPSAAVRMLPLARCIVEILANAVEASNKGQSVLVSGSLADNGASITLTVRDNGEGFADIPAALRIGTSTREGHRGVGLPVAKAILARGGGHLECSSQKGAGSTVTLHIPTSRP